MVIALYLFTIIGALKSKEQLSMSDIIDLSCVNLQMTKADKNNNTTANIDDGLRNKKMKNKIFCFFFFFFIEIISSSEQSDVLQNENHEKSEHSSNNETNTNLVSSSNDENELSPNPYKDFSGIDTESFITTTLRHNPKDRTLLLTLEKVFQEFIPNEEQTSYQFQAMNSCSSDFSKNSNFFSFLIYR